MAAVQRIVQGRSTQRVEPQCAILALPAPVKNQAVTVKNQAASMKNQAVTEPQCAILALPAPVKNQAVAPGRFARGSAVELRNRIARVHSGRWLVIYLRAEVVFSGADSTYVVRYPAYNGVPSREARVPAEDVREARPAPATRPAPPSKRPSPDQPTVTTDPVACNKTKIVRTGKGIPMDAPRRFMEEVKAKCPDAELPPTRNRKHP